MQYVTSFERSGIKLGVLEGIGASLEIKFGKLFHIWFAYFNSIKVLWGRHLANPGYAI